MLLLLLQLLHILHVLPHGYWQQHVRLLLLLLLAACSSCRQHQRLVAKLMLLPLLLLGCNSLLPNLWGCVCHKLHTNGSILAGQPLLL
jgi:hypothetical protein